VVVLEYAILAALFSGQPLLFLYLSRPPQSCVDTCWAGPIVLAAVAALAGVVLGVGLIAALVLVVVREWRGVRAGGAVEPGRIMGTATTTTMRGLVIAPGILTAALVVTLIVAAIRGG